MKKFNILNNDLVVSFSYIKINKLYSKISLNEFKYCSLNANVTYFSRDVEFNTESLVSSLWGLNIDKFSIILINNNSEFVEPYNNSLINSNDFKLDIITISYKKFLERFNTINKYEENYEDLVGFNINSSIFIFRNIPWSSVVSDLNRLNIKISGGFTSKRHLTSHLNIRHISYLLSMFNYSLTALQSCIKFDNINRNWVLPLVNTTIKRKKYNDNLYVVNSNNKFKSSIPLTEINQKRNYYTIHRPSLNKLKIYQFRKIHNKSLINSFSPSYNAINDVIKTELSNFEKQKRIEEIFRKFWRVELYNLIASKDTLGINNIGLQIISRQLKSLDEDLLILLNKPSFIRKKSYMKIINKANPSLIISIVMGKIIPFVVKYKDLEDQPVTSLIISIGESIYKEVVFDMYKDELKSNNISSEVSFNEYIKCKDLEISEDELVKLGLDIIQFVTNRTNFVEVKEIYNKKKNVYKRYIYPKEDFNNLIDNLTYLETEELPMLINPLPWEINDKGEIIKYGGNITNNEYKFKSLISISQKNPLAKKMKFNKQLIDTVNKMASTEYTINKKVLNIITEKEYYLKQNEPLIHFKLHKESQLLSKYIKDKKFSKINEIITYNSKYLYDTSIINIARLMINVEKFFFTNFIDWRGRIYTSSCTLNIQGGELARGLLLFANGEILDDKGLYALKVYTANAFGLDKKSKKDRITWVDNNINEIINCPENNIWLSADEPIVFLSCALELKEYKKNPKFISRLPILLDATCNGLQHLSAIANDINLAERVNISPSTNENAPNDIYSDLINPIKESINKLVKNNIEHYNLSKLNITRKLIKRGIMTITYGVTIIGILNQLMSEHFIKSGVVKNRNVYIPKDKDKLGDVSLSYKDLYELSKIIYNTLFKSHPTLDKIMIYFHEIVKLMNNLELSIQWITPYGLHISQRYRKFTKYDITSVMERTRRKVTLRRPVFNNDNIPCINNDKQINSFIPNFIHSMDASNIIFLINRINEKFNFNVVTIHDCFGVHANKAELLSHLVKESFISIYGNNDCIDKFHSHILYNIKAVYKIEGNLVINKYGNTYEIPEKPILGNMNLKSQLLESKYFIN